MIEIPSPLSTDPEDVAWALSTAEAMWKREGHLDALTWVRRAAEAAETAGNDERAIMLMRAAADIAEWIRDNAPDERSAPAEEPPPAEPLPRSAVPPSRPPQSTMDVDEEELLEIEVDLEDEDAAAGSADEEAPRSPFVSASGPSAWEDEEVVTSAPRIGAIGARPRVQPPGPPPKRPPGPPPRRPMTAPPPARPPETAIVAEEEASPISSSALILEDSSGPSSAEPPAIPPRADQADTTPPPAQTEVAKPSPKEPRAPIAPEPTLASPTRETAVVPRILTSRSTTHRQWPAPEPAGGNIEETQSEWPPQEPTLQAGLPSESAEIEETQTEWPPPSEARFPVATRAPSEPPPDEERGAQDADEDQPAPDGSPSPDVGEGGGEEEVAASEGAFDELSSLESPLPSFASEPELPTFEDEPARAAFASSEAATSLHGRAAATPETAGEAIARETRAAESTRASSGSMRASKAPVLDFDGDILEPEPERRPASHAPTRRAPSATPPAAVSERSTAPSQPPTRKVSMPAELIEASLAQERARREHAEHLRREAAEKERAEQERVEAEARARVEEERREAAERASKERAVRLASVAPPSPPPPEAAPATTAPASPDLSDVPELDDLPEDVLTVFAAASEIHLLSKDEEVNGFALAYVLEGELDLSATVADVPAARVGAGTMVRTRGTIDAHLDVRLVGITEAARVVTWDAAAVTTALRDCPWVEDDLRAAGDRWQALAGITLGPLGDRLDPELRSALTAELQARTLAPGEVLAKAGEPVPGLFVVGAGELALQNDGVDIGELTPGDVVFPSETISHQKAPSTAVAGPGGAVVLGADRKRMQELLMSFPPLLDLLSGL